MAAIDFLFIRTFSKSGRVGKRHSCSHFALRGGAVVQLGYLVSLNQTTNITITKQTE